MAKILLVEDDKDLAFMVRSMLLAERHNVDHVDNGHEAARHLKVYPYDLIVLDWELPELSGLEILRQFRAAGGTSAVLMLTGRSGINEKEAGLDSGADDYLSKPFHMKELAARVRALLRRPAAIHAGALAVKSVTLDPGKFRVTRDGQPVQLLPKEFALLEFLMRNANQVFTPEALLNRIWATDSDATDEAIRTTVKRIRKKLDSEGAPSIIRTVHGVGYVIDSP